MPPGIKKTFDKLGIPEAEKKFLAGVGAQYESEVVYHKLREELSKQGVIFLDMDAGAARARGSVARSTSAPSSRRTTTSSRRSTARSGAGGSFIYVPKGVKVDLPLQAYFRINAENMGQFERDADHRRRGRLRALRRGLHGADLHDRFAALRGGRDHRQAARRCRYTTIQNWSKNVYNLVTKRAVAYADATMEWVDGNLGRS